MFTSLLKHHLRRIIGETRLPFVEISTFLVEVEACLNSRPLQALTDDSEDLDVLTPDHVLIEARSTSSRSRRCSTSGEPIGLLASAATDARPLVAALVARVSSGTDASAQVVDNARKSAGRTAVPSQD
ncbi:hypothetical protein RF55_9553 [Lasius niger]|uniref:Uncharacterized protein n=1 Tax=Lasius niger TaxID=67767 RepID=A0A0J7KK47_LASNI|nr:hypothetical protein RF55_9553 [Lasius niger]